VNLDEDDRQLARDILGTDDPAVIEPAISAFCRTHLGRDAVNVGYVSFSVGAGFGIALDDGRSVFMKVWPARVSRESLESVHVIQHALATQGFPAPRVLLNPQPFMAGYGSVMEWCDSGAQLDAHVALVRREMAASLARLIALAAPFASLSGLERLDYPTDGAFGKAHNVLFDFQATGRGAEWIDEIAIAAAHRAQAGPSRMVVGHRDWSMHNVRLHLDENGAPTMSVVYDWDSLVVARETDVVGVAAAIYPVTWDLEIVPRFPTRDEMLAFVAEYEQAAGRRFSAEESDRIGAAATYVLAYIARCEHCHGNPEDAQSARVHLRAHVAASRPFASPGL
jgi:hypothetical protein